MRATDENLKLYAVKPMTAWLIQAANTESTLRYGEIKERLRSICGFNDFRATRVGKAAMFMMDEIHAVFPDAPLLNILVVQQDKKRTRDNEIPSIGAGPFMARRFQVDALADDNIIETNIQLWEEYVNKAKKEVYECDQWTEIFERVFSEPFPSESEKVGVERDSIIHRGVGEGDAHKALRLWTKDNPQDIDKDYADFETDTEVVLDSADRVDVVYYGSNRIIALEVKSYKSNDEDLKRGVFQCIKYRAVMSAMDIRNNPPVEAILVVQRELPDALQAIADRNCIKVAVISPDMISD